MMVGSGARHETVAFTITHNGHTQLYTHISRYQYNFHEPQPVLIRRWFFHKDELIDSREYLVDILGGTLNVPYNNVTSPTVVIILVVITSNPAPHHMGL